MVSITGQSHAATVFARAVKACGGQARLAGLLGGRVRPQHIWNWLNRDKLVPAEYCRAIEKIAAEHGERVTRYELRPDVFGDAPEREAA